MTKLNRAKPPMPRLSINASAAAMLMAVVGLRKATMPPGRATRAKAAIPAAGSGSRKSRLVASAASNTPATKGRRSASAAAQTSEVTGDPEGLAADNSAARRTIASESSQPTAGRAPLSASNRTSSPGPVPTSSTAAPDGNARKRANAASVSPHAPACACVK
ncbi:MAG: hypothetical protein NT169_25940 [Chloroflexi bacterium]|nr:hypothetical protein [Chloroflexota bacterium]